MGHSIFYCATLGWVENSIGHYIILFMFHKYQQLIINHHKKELNCSIMFKITTYYVCVETKGTFNDDKLSWDELKIILLLIDKTYIHLI